MANECSLGWDDKLSEIYPATEIHEGEERQMAESHLLISCMHLYMCVPGSLCMFMIVPVYGCVRMHADLCFEGYFYAQTVQESSFVCLSGCYSGSVWLYV